MTFNCGFSLYIAYTSSWNHNHQLQRAALPNIVVQLHCKKQLQTGQAVKVCGDCI